MQKINLNILRYFFMLLIMLLPTKVLGVTGTALTTNGGSLESGTYYLKANTTLTNNITVAQGKNVTINLNGYILKGNGNGSVIKNNGTLTIIDEIDSSATKKIHYGSLTSIECVILRANRKELYVEGGNYPDGKNWETEIVNESIWNYEGTVSNLSKVPESKIAIEGGIITGGKSSLGAAIYNNGGNLYFKSGTLTGNHAYRTTDTGTATNGHGGAIFSNIYNNVVPIFEMTGGCISYNFADGSGGAFCIRNGSCLMKSGIVEYNQTTASGGGVNVQGNANGRPEFIFGADITDTVWFSKYANNSESIPVIRNNKTRDTRNTGNGGGIHVQTGDLTYNAGKIQNNRTTLSGGGIYAYKRF